MLLEKSEFAMKLFLFGFDVGGHGSETELGVDPGHDWPVELAHVPVHQVVDLSTGLCILWIHAKKGSSLHHLKVFRYSPWVWCELVHDILHNCPRLPNCEVSVLQSWNAMSWVDGQKLGLILLSLNYLSKLLSDFFEITLKRSTSVNLKSTLFSIRTSSQALAGGEIA